MRNGMQVLHERLSVYDRYVQNVRRIDETMPVTDILVQLRADPEIYAEAN